MDCPTMGPTFGFLPQGSEGLMQNLVLGVLAMGL